MIPKRRNSFSTQTLFGVFKKEYVAEEFDYSNSILVTFMMEREQDSTGVSGIGIVLDGVIFPNGKVVVCWRKPPRSIGIFNSFEEFEEIHVKSHPENRTVIHRNTQVEKL